MIDLLFDSIGLDLVLTILRRLDCLQAFLIAISRVHIEDFLSALIGALSKDSSLRFFKLAFVTSHTCICLG